MLSGIKLVDRADAERLAREERQQHKKEKKKQHKMDKKTSKKKHKSSDGDGGGSSNSGGELGGGAARRRRHGQQWDNPSGSSDNYSEGGGGGKPGGGVEREDWMTKPMARAKTEARLAAEEEQKERQEERRRDPDHPFVSERELNPYLRNGGSGVPPEKEEAAAGVGAAAVPCTRPTAGVGDGGASWRLKALKRAQQQAGKERGGVPRMVSKGRAGACPRGAASRQLFEAAGMAHLHTARDRRIADPEYEVRQAERRRMRGVVESGEGSEGEVGGKGGKERGGNKAAYLSEMKNRRSQMQRPHEAGSLSWRRGSERQREGGERQAEGGESRGRRDSRGSDRSRNERGEQRQEGEQDEWKQHPGGPLWDERRPGGNRDKVGCGGDGRPWGRGGREDEGRRSMRDPLGRRQDADVLKAAAAELNQFSADGSFMEQFQQQQQARQEGEEAQPAAGAEVQPSGSSGSGSEEGQQQPWRQGERSSTVADMAAERASLVARPAAAATVASGGGEGEGVRQPAAVAGGGRGSHGSGGSNLSVAAMLRARLTGKAPPPEAEARPPPQHETVVLPLVDVRGLAMPGAFGREEAGAGLPDGGRKQKHVQRYKGGTRSRYFADDDDTDLQTLMKRTKHGDEGDMDLRLAAGIMRSQRYKEADHDADAEYDHDAGLEMLERRPGKGKEAQVAREKQRQVREYKRYSSAVEQCRLCFASASRPRHLAVAFGQSSYLALPVRGRLVPGHCVIVPAEHVASTRQVDEQVWSELRNFKKCLIQMFMKQHLEVIFFETAVRLGDMRSHAMVEAVPVPPSVAGRAPMFFRKAVDDATSEWAQHHAKRLIDTKAKGLRGSIPPNFPYLHVEFGISDGFVHVIDDEEKFDRGLARSVMIGLLSLPQEDMHRRACQENATIQRHWAEDFRKQFDPYNWTKMLE